MTNTTPLPEWIRKEVKLWQQGFGAIPQSYIGFHAGLAERALESLKGDFDIHKTEMRDDGWLDGMKVLFAIVEHKKSGKIAKLRWHDGNQEFFLCHDNAGASPLRLARGFNA